MIPLGDDIYLMTKPDVVYFLRAETRPKGSYRPLKYIEDVDIPEGFTIDGAVRNGNRSFTVERTKDYVVTYPKMKNITIRVSAPNCSHSLHYDDIVARLS